MSQGIRRFVVRGSESCFWVLARSGTEFHVGGQTPPDDEPMETWENKEQYMFRKLLVVAAAIAMPVSVVAVSGGIASASSASGSGPISCHVASTVAFAAPGLSKAGSVSTAKTSSVIASPLVVSGTGCTGTSAKTTITSASTKCTGKGLPVPYTACKIGDYGFDSWKAFTANGTSSIKTAFAHFNFTLNGNAFQTTTTKAAEVVLGACKTEVGFAITGTVTAPTAYKGKVSTLTACLGKVTGTGLKSTTSFLSDVNGAGFLKTASVVPRVSTIAIS